MTKYTRLTGKVFGSSATATGDDPEIGQFGSALAGTYNGTTDIATIQKLPAWQKGFIGCVTPTTQFPPLPEMTGFGKVLSHQICYLLQQGVPEYDSGTTYYIGNWCAYNGKLYISKTDENLNNLPTDTTNWEQFTGGFSRNYGEIVTSSLPLTDNTLHLADGSLLSATNYPEFVSYVANLYNSLPSGEFSQATQNTTLGNNNWTDIAYGNGVYVAVDYNGYCSTSTDGENWSARTKILNITEFTAITYGDNIFVAITTDGIIATSPDGETWTRTGTGSVMGNYGWIDIAYGDNRYIAIGDEGAYSSTDLTTWSKIDDITTGSLKCVIYNKSFFIVQSSWVYMYNKTYSQWQTISGSFNLYYSLYVNIAFDGLNYIAINNNGEISKSTDFINWTTPQSDTNLGNNNWRGIVSGNKIVTLSNTGYISIKEKASTEVFTTEADWQTSYTTYGECGKYVYNSSANTVRLPLYSSYFTNTVNPQNLGTLTEASLPNIKGAFNHETTGGTATGAFSIGSSIAGQNAAPGGDADHLIEFNAGNYNSIYKDSATTVNTQSIKQLVYIVVAK